MTEILDPPLKQQEQLAVIQETKRWIEAASTIYGRKISQIDVLFNLRGRTSGMFCSQGKRQWIRYNPWIFAKHYEQSLSVTVPHEVAHYVCYTLYGRKTKPHGKEWKSIMARFGVDASATCNLDISDLPQRRLARHSYKCACRSHQLTSIRHNRIQRGLAQYACPKCREPLVYAQG